jgi:hypothetical protein
MWCAVSAKEQNRSISRSVQRNYLSKSKWLLREPLLFLVKRSTNDSRSEIKVLVRVAVSEAGNSSNGLRHQNVYEMRPSINGLNE